MNEERQLITAMYDHIAYALLDDQRPTMNTNVYGRIAYALLDDQRPMTIKLRPQSKIQNPFDLRPVPCNLMLAITPFGRFLEAVLILVLLASCGSSGAVEPIGAPPATRAVPPPAPVTIVATAAPRPTAP